MYKTCYKNLLSIPTISGYKTQKEKFCGAEMTATIEGYIPGSGRAIQCATSHCLGQNFSKMFNIQYQDENEDHQYVWQNSWGFTTRSIGVMLMTHGDDKGPIFPPPVSPIQIVIIPIFFKKNKEVVLEYIDEVFNMIKDKFRVHVDMSNHKPGWKQNYWERMGAPLRLEIGPMDADKRTVRAVNRYNSQKEDLTVDEYLITYLDSILNIQISEALFDNAQASLDNAIKRDISEWNEFIEAISEQKMCLIPFCNLF